MHNTMGHHCGTCACQSVPPSWRGPARCAYALASGLQSVCDRRVCRASVCIWTVYGAGGEPRGWDVGARERQDNYKAERQLLPRTRAHTPLSLSGPPGHPRGPRLLREQGLLTRLSIDFQHSSAMAGATSKQREEGTEPSPSAPPPPTHPTPGRTAPPS